MCDVLSFGIGVYLGKCATGKTCIRRPPRGPAKSGLLGQVACLSRLRP